MFLLMFIGTYLFKAKLVTIEGSKQLGNLLLKIVVPILIFKSFIIEYSYDKLVILFLTFIISAIVLSISILISHLFYKNDPILNIASAFSNVGFMGIPLVQVVLGEQAVFFITCTIAQLVVLQWTYGLKTITNDNKHIHIKNIIKNPVVIAFVLGLLVFVLNIKIPDILYNTFTYVSNMNTPLAMIICGIYLGQISINKMFRDINLYKFSFIRLILIPFITLIFLYFIPSIYYDVKIAILIACCAPAGANTAVLASAYNKDYTKAVSSICISTLLSIFSIPLIILIATKIF